MSEKVTYVRNVRHEDYDVYVGRPSNFGNPFQIGRHGSRENVIRKYRAWIERDDMALYRDYIRQELRGKRLGCYCAPLPCHGDILAEIANA